VQKLLKYLPLLLGLTILALLIPFVPWGEVWPLLRQLSPAAIAGLLACSLLYYLGRSLRYWKMLQYLGEPVPFRKVALAVLAAQPVAVLPGGELYRAEMIKRYGKVSHEVTLPSVFSQSVIEAIGLVGVALVGAVFLNRYVAILIGVAAALVGVWQLIKRLRPSTGHKAVNRLPWVNVSHEKVESFMEKNRRLFGRRTFPVLLSITLIGMAAGTGMLFIGAAALGEPLALEQAVVGYTLPTALEVVSFLPAGLGVNEQGSVVVMRVFGQPLAAAVALTLIVRLFTLGAGFLFGFAAMGVARIAGYDRED
jgi:uncharacterized protein (TIRG00374 family)